MKVKKVKGSLGDFQLMLTFLLLTLNIFCNNFSLKFHILVQDVPYLGLDVLYLVLDVPYLGLDVPYLFKKSENKI